MDIENKEKKLEKLKEEILKNLKDDLSKSATNLVFGKGSSNAEILFIGEAPGEQEDLKGIPFVGKAGKNLDSELQKIGLSLDDCYIANILKYRPPKNRNPKNDEIKAHTPYLIEQIKIIKPKIIVTLGNYSSKFVLGGFDTEKMDKIDGISSIRGKPKKIKFNNFEFIVVPMFHPAAILYRPQLREYFEKDFRYIKKIIKGM
jgi:uracil-DNA glycosylase